MNKVEYRNILIAEDNDSLRDKLTAYFSVTNKVVPCANLQSALEAVENNKFDIMLVDVILPDGNGLQLIEHAGETPVIILSDLGSDSNMIDGFTAGATDYIVKPASCTLIEMRMALRLLPDSKAKIISHGLVLDTAKRTAVYNKKTLELTSSEFNVLMFLMQNAGNYFTATEIYEQVWNMSHLNTTTVKVHISNLRKKMLSVSSDCAKLLIQEFGRGYAFIN